MKVSGTKPRFFNTLRTAAEIDDAALESVEELRMFGTAYIVDSRAQSYVRKLVTELSGGVFGYLDSVLERHSFDEFGELI